jgi:N-acetylgalactosamine-6-sulfatase
MTEKPSRRAFLRTAAGGAALAAIARALPCSAAGPAAVAAANAQASAPPGRRPHIIFILSDDLGYGDVGCYGSPDIRTPAIDRLASEGVRLSECYTAAPECTPTRTAFLTGRYPQRVGGLECAIGVGNVGRYDDAIRLAEKHELGLPADETSIARMLKDAGYATALCGKWHLGYEKKFFPDRHGFDTWIGPLGGACDYFLHTEPDGTNVLYEDGAPVRRDEYMTDLITDAAADRIRRHAGDRPLFLYVAYTAPHAPYQGPNDRAKGPAEKDKMEEGTHAAYVQMIEHMDRGVGRILAALAEKGLAGGALVFFTSDNGANRMGSNGRLSGAKGGLYEGGIRVPCIVRWPGVLPRGMTNGQPCITMDLSASIVRAAGAAPPPGRALDGIDVLADVAAGRPVQPRTLFWRARRGERTWRAVRDGALKYLSRQDGAATTEWLFDLAADPAEKEDLLARRPDDGQRLKALLAGWEREVQPRR